MTTFKGTLDGALSEIKQRRADKALVRHEQPPPGGYRAPVLPEELQRQVSVLAGHARFKGGGEADFLMQAEPVFHHQAAEMAHKLRRAMLPAERELIEDWVVTLSMALINPPNDPNVLAFRVQGVARFCAELPAECWTEQTLMQAVDTFTHWPSVAEIKKLLRPRLEEMQRTRRALERIAKAEPATVSNTESTEPYRPRAYLPDEREARHMPKLESEKDLAEAGLKPLAQEPERTVEEQIRAYGEAGRGTDLLEARRQQFEQPRGPKP